MLLCHLFSKQPKNADSFSNEPKLTYKRKWKLDAFALILWEKNIFYSVDDYSQAKCNCRYFYFIWYARFSPITQMSLYAFLQFSLQQIAYFTLQLQLALKMTFLPQKFRETCNKKEMDFFQLAINKLAKKSVHKSWHIRIVFEMFLTFGGSWSSLFSAP